MPFAGGMGRVVIALVTVEHARQNTAQSANTDGTRARPASGMGSGWPRVRVCLYRNAALARSFGETETT
jgi:hypothetical protein